MTEGSGLLVVGAVVAESVIDGGEVGVMNGLGPLMGCLVTSGAAVLKGGGFFSGYSPAMFL